MRRKVRVLHVIKTLELGGAEKNLLNLINAMDRNCIESHVAFTYGGELEDQFKQAGARLVKVSPRKSKIRSWDSFRIIYNLVRYIRKNKIDIVHTHTFNAHLWGGVAAKFTRCKLVEHVHDYRYMENEEFKTRHGIATQYRFIRYFKNFSDRVVVLTATSEQFLIKHHFYPSDRVHRILNGIPLVVERLLTSEEKVILRKRFEIPESASIVLTTARMAEEKNIELILEIAPDVICEKPDAQFLIAGDGPLLPILTERCRRKDLSRNVKFIGYAEDVEQLLKISDIFLLPSFLELHSISLLEALKMGVPVVISKDVGCHNEFIIHGENGMLLDPFTQDGWAEGILHLLNDPAYAARMGKEGRRRCEELFDIQKTACQFEKLYGELAS